MTLVDRLRTRALAYPEVSVGASCNREAFKVRKKGFLYLEDKAGTAIVLLKLGPSRPAAEALAAERPGEVEIGKVGGWVTLRIGPEATPPAALDGWVDESFRLSAPKAVLRRLDGA